MNWSRAHLHGLRRLPGDEPGLGVQEGHRHEIGGHLRTRRRRGPRQGTAGPRGRGRRVVQEPPQRRPAPLQPRDLHERPAPDRRGHHVRLRRADHAAELPRLPGGVAGTHPALGRTLHHRALPADRRAGGQALPGAVRRDPGRPVRGPAPQGLPGPRRHELRRLRHRRGAGEGEPGHHRALVQRGAAGEQAAAPAGHLRTGRHLHRDRERRGHLRLRLPHPGGPQLGVLHTPTAGSTSPAPSTSATSARCRKAATATPA